MFPILLFVACAGTTAEEAVHSHDDHEHGHVHPDQAMVATSPSGSGHDWTHGELARLLAFLATL